MDEPLTWLVLQYVQSIVERITVAAGFHTDLGAGTVTLDTSQVDEDATEPYTVIVGGDVATVDEASSRRTIRGDMDVVIDYAVPLREGVNAELLAHRGRADIVRAVLTDTERARPHGLLSLRLVSSTLGPPETGASMVMAQVTLRAGLSETILPA